jgi:hypothetical protein
MTAKELFTNAFNNSRYHIDEVIDRTYSIQCNYTYEEQSYFIRMSEDRIIDGRIGDDGKAYAHGLPISVLSYLISHYNDVKSL